MRKVTTIFGGSGFIGRYVVRRVAARGHIVRIAVRDPEAALFLKPMGAVGQIVPLYAPVTDEAAVSRAVQGASWVVNLTGVLAPRRSKNFEEIHVDGSARIARLAASAGVERLVQMSALSAEIDSPSLYARTKAAGELAVRAQFPEAVILRPSLVFGPEDIFFNRFAAMAELLPFVPVISGQTKFQPVYVGDVADAVLAGLERSDTTGKLFELGGPRALSMREVLALILEETQRRRPLITVPSWIAWCQALILERLPGRILTRDQLRLLTHDNVVTNPQAGLNALGITAHPMEQILPMYLARFRPGGGRREWRSA